MSRKLFCARLKRQAPGLASAPYPGALGERIYHEISQDAWEAWLAKQTMLINEKKLNMMDLDHRQLLEKTMIGFLFQDQEVSIAGYMPESEVNS